MTNSRLSKQSRWREGQAEGMHHDKTRTCQGHHTRVRSGSPLTLSFSPFSSPRMPGRPFFWAFPKLIRRFLGRFRNQGRGRGIH